jgi:crossover junction endodeoxyribonuclease RuvC
MLVLGVDPGLKGGLAWVRYRTTTGTATLLTADAMPTVQAVKGKGTQGRVSGASLAHLLRMTATPDLAVIEAVSARPEQGVTSMFSFGRGLGVVEGVLAALGVPVEYLTPQTWRGLVNHRGDKDGARAKAQALFPIHAGKFARVKDDGVAEAVLIALAGAKKFGGVPQRLPSPASLLS